MTSEYEKQATDFATKHNVKLHILDEEFRPYFPDDTQARSVYKCRLTRRKDGHNLSYTFSFGQSINKVGIEPTMYEVLASITKSEPESFEEWCNCFGYNEDSIKDRKLYKAILKEWEAVHRLFNDCLEELQEIA